MAKPRAASPADPSTPADEPAPATPKIPAAKAPATAKVAAAKAPATAKLPAAEEPATAKVAPAVPLGPRVSTAALRFAAVAYVATALTPLFFYLSIPFPGNLFVITASPYAYYVPFGILLIALIVAAVASDRPPPTKMVAILLVVIGASLIGMSLVVVVPWLALLAPVPLFLSWALTAGFRGWGYVGLVFALAIIAIQWVSGVLISWGALFAIPAIGIAIIAAAAIAGTAALERVSARRQESAA